MNYREWPFLIFTYFAELNHFKLFYSLQAAEKAVKAVQYNVDANQKKDDHNLPRNCYGFDDSVLSELAVQLECLVINSAHMRYPDRMSYPKIPHDVYTAAQAEGAFRIATKILERVRVKLN